MIHTVISLTQFYKNISLKRAYIVGLFRIPRFEPLIHHRVQILLPLLETKRLLQLLQLLLLQLFSDPQELLAAVVAAAAAAVEACEKLDFVVVVVVEDIEAFVVDQVEVECSLLAAAAAAAAVVGMHTLVVARPWQVAFVEATFP